tara:strand:+ start:1105 stop:1587 length:483 start_codon:yes stop_codon:yes gene_type:complete
VNEKLLLRYLKVKALAEGGDGGEREVAKKILRRLEEKHPGIEAAASACQTAREASPPQSDGGPRPARTGNWEQIFRYAAGFYSAVRETVEDITDAYYGKELAEVDVGIDGYSRSGSVFVRLKFPFDVVTEARSLNPPQKEAFRQALHDRLEEYLDAILEE